MQDILSIHLQELPEGTLEAQTEIGFFHLTLLHLNRPELIAHRRWKLRIAEDSERISFLEKEAHALAKRLDSLERALRESG